ncbi:MAG: zinc ribbon domain-containing protein [Planctomycetes bacterium]|nr:zinc ribbon domain-containing protein [Planctomycetota bacterium]
MDQDGPGEGARPSRPCPACGEEVLEAARKCRHCGEWFAPTLRAAVRERGQPPRVPVVLFVWGSLFMLGAGFVLAMTLLQTLALAFVLRPGLGSFPPLYWGLLAFVGLFLVALLRLGQALRRGERRAVVGVGLLAVLGVFLSAAKWLTGEPDVEAVLVMTALACGPPLAVGWARWRDLQPRQAAPAPEGQPGSSGAPSSA